MNKGVIAFTALGALLIGACAANVDLPSVNTIHKEYAAQIKEELQAEEWCYTWQEVEGAKTNTQIISFYVFQPTASYSQWLCSKENDKLNCEMIFIKWTN